MLIDKLSQSPPTRCRNLKDAVLMYNQSTAVVTHLQIPVTSLIEKAAQS